MSPDAPFAQFIPSTPRQAADLAGMQSLWERYGEQLYLRRCLPAHFTASALVLSPDRAHMLMVFHLQYHSYSIPGGHADGERRLIGTALRECREETGLCTLTPLSRSPLSWEILPVFGHNKNGRYVGAHLHLNASFIFLGDPKEAIRPKPDENSAVRWIPVSQLENACKEPHMLPVYRTLLDIAQSLQLQPDGSTAPKIP